MAHTLRLPTLTDPRGSLTVLDQPLPFPVERVYWIHDVPPGKERAGHRHRTARQLLFCLEGGCVALVRGEGRKEIFPLVPDGTGLLLEPEEWHLLREFLPRTVLLVLSSCAYDPDDCVPEEEPG